MPDLMAHFGAERWQDAAWYHGTPDVRTWHRAVKGIHIGTEEAARQALHSRIGEPAEGVWDGTREYGKTLLKGQNPDLRSGYNIERRPDHYPQPATYHQPVRQPGGGWGHGPPVSFEDREPGKVYNSRGAVYGDHSPVPMDARPSIFPVHIKGPMTNTPATPHEDFKANGYMSAALRRGHAKSGYFYRNVAEDEGSISAVVPSAAHLERPGEPKTAGLLEHFAAAVNPPCHYCHEPLDDEDVDNETTSHEECWEMHQCPVHGEHEDDPVLAEQHRDTYTDWGEHLPFRDGIHRGFPKQLPPEVHAMVHDSSRPVPGRAHVLRNYLHREGFHGGTQEDVPYGTGTEGHLGVHWSPSRTMAESWGTEDHDEGPIGGGPKPSVTHIVLHAKSPDYSHIETDPDHLEARHMYGYDHERSEHEVPLKFGAPVGLTGISWKQGGTQEWNHHDFRRPEHHLAAAEGGGFPNPYHPAFGGRPEFSHTWFHGTRGTSPEFHEQYREGNTGSEPRMSQPPDERAMHSGWPQPNKLLGVHLSPLHRVAHRFAKGIYPTRPDPERGREGRPGTPSALVHARLHFDSPAHYPTEKHLNLAVARYANDHYPGWHDDKLNASQQWSYSDTEGTHRDWHAEPHYDPKGTYEGNQDFHRLAGKAQSILQWHPHLPEIIEGFKQHLEGQGHHGITYGNEVEGPGQGGHDGEWDKEFADHTSQDVRHISAIATRPSQIETRHVEHIAPPETEPQAHEVEHHPPDSRYRDPDQGWESGRNGYASDSSEDKAMFDRVGAFHAEHGGAYPGHARTAARMRYRIQMTVAGGYEVPDWHRPLHDTLESAQEEMTKLRQWDPDRQAIPEAEIREDKTASLAALYHSGGRDFPGDEEWVHLGTREAALNRARDWHEERARRGEPAAQAYLHTVHMAGSHYPSERSDNEANDPVWRDIAARSGHTVLPYVNEYEDPGTVSYLAHRSAVRLLRTEPLHAKQAAAGPFLHGGPNRVEPGDVIRQDAMPASHGRLQHNFFTTSRGVAEDAADMRDGRGHGWIHTVEPTDSYERDTGEDQSWKSRAPLRVISVEPGRLNGSTPHPPILREARIIDMASSSGDRFYECSKGHDHWGAYGAAGLLIRHRGEDGQHRYLLQKRSPYVNEPNTWSVPGGAIGRHESPEDGAWREAREEMGSIPRHVTTHHTIKSTDCGDWAYHTVVADAGEHFMPRGNGETEHETAGVGWHTADEVEELRDSGDLHPGFAKSWETVRRSRGPRTAARDSMSLEDVGNLISANDYPAMKRRAREMPRPDDTGPLEQLTREVRERGIDEPLHVVNRTYLDNGQHRYWAAQDAGLTRVPVKHTTVRTTEFYYGSKTAAAGYREHVERIHPRDLLPYAQREAWRMQDPGGRRHISELAEGIRQKGYQPRLHGGMSGDTHSFPPSFPITLVHDDENSWLWNGHHRAFALNEAGYDKPVPVLVKDFRTARTAVLHPDPPDYAHGIQSGGSQVEWVRREKLNPYREFRHDRETGESHYLPTGHRFPDRYNRQRWDEMDSSVAEHGMHEPVLLEYNPWTRKMHIGEGHHRLESAERAGHEMVPVWGLKTSQEHPHARAVPGEPKVRPEHFEGGYFPSSFKPSDVLPAHWMKSKQEAFDDEWRHPTAAASVTYSHQPQPGGLRHVFRADDDGVNIAGLAEVNDKGDHLSLDKVWTHPERRGRGIASRLVRNVMDHFSGREIRLKPEPYGWPAEPGLGEDQLRGFYRGHGFEDDDQNPDHMRRQAAAPVYYHGTSSNIKGGVIEPGHGRTWSSPAPGGEQAYNSGEYSYATTDYDLAKAHARPDDVTGIHWRSPAVYRVRPTGPVETDPEETDPEHPKLFMSRHPWTVEGQEWSYWDEQREQEARRHQAVITPGSLPTEQQAAFDADDHREHRSRMLEVARHPAPGTRVWRGEIRRSDEDPASAESTGMHWSASPDPIITGWAHEGEKHVVWQGVVENHEEQAFPRSHPIWSGQHQSFDHEAEVRFRPGARVKLEGAYVHEPKEYPGGMATTPGHLVPRIPERTHPDWKWHPLDRHIRIKYTGQGASDYEHLGIPREAGRQLPVTEIGPLYHGTTQERAGRILEHGFEGDTVHLTPHADLAGSYAGGRVIKDQGGAPAVLKVERVRGVSGHETGYTDPEKSRASGADYQDKGPEVVVLNPAAIHGISRHAAADPAMVP